MPHITMQSGVAQLLAAAHDRVAMYRSLEGDLGQMAAQTSFLRAHEFDIAVNGGVPCFRTENDYRRGLKLIWEHRVAGWWNYRRHLLDDGFCTETEYSAALKAQNQNS